MNIKHTLLALVAMTSAASAASIYVNFNGNGSGGPATGSPFGVPASDWVNAAGSSNSGGIAVGSGSATLTWTSGAGTWGKTGATTDEESVYRGFLNENNYGAPSFTVSGLDTEFGGQSYKIIIYGYSDDSRNGKPSQFTLNGGSTVYESTVTSSTGGLPGYYLETTFDNVSGDTFTINAVLDGDANRRSTIAGFTVVAVPEPSSAALLGLAGLALILRRRK